MKDQKTGTLEAKLRARVERAVSEQIEEWRKVTFRTMKPENHTVYIDLSRFKNIERVNFSDIVDQIERQRKPSMLEHAGDKEVADFIKKVDSMQAQIDGLYEGI